MNRSNQYDELDEMSVPRAKTDVLDDEVKIGKSAKTDLKTPSGKKAHPKKTPYQLQKEQQKRRQNVRIALIVAGVFAALLIVLIVVAVIMTGRVPVEIIKAERDPGRSFYYNEGNVPGMTADGVRGALKEVYFTVDGDLAVTLKLGNGTDKELEVTSIDIELYNGSNQTVAKQAVSKDKFQKKCLVPAHGQSEVYFVIDKANVVLRDDPLSRLGATLMINSQPTDGIPLTTKPQGAQVGDGPKDIANNRDFYENTSNIPELSADGVKASVIRARYTNDGSLVVDFSLSNGTTGEQTPTAMDVSLKNSKTGEVIAATVFEDLGDQAPVLKAGTYGEMQLIIDAAQVTIKDDALSDLSATVGVSAKGAVAVTTTTAAA